MSPVIVFAVKVLEATKKLPSAVTVLAAILLAATIWELAPYIKPLPPNQPSEVVVTLPVPLTQISRAVVVTGDVMLNPLLVPPPPGQTVAVAPVDVAKVEYITAYSLAVSAHT